MPFVPPTGPSVATGAVSSLDDELGDLRTYFSTEDAKVTCFLVRVEGSPVPVSVDCRVSGELPVVGGPSAQFAFSTAAKCSPLPPPVDVSKSDSLTLVIVGGNKPPVSAWVSTLLDKTSLSLAGVCDGDSVT